MTPTHRIAPPGRRAGRGVLLFLAAFVLVSLVVGIAIGPVTIPIRTVADSLLGGEAYTTSAVHRVIVRQIRLPRVLLGLLVGSALAVSGTAMQGLFRNPLASPYVLGVASGASTGAALAILVAESIVLLPLGAFFGASLAVLVVYRLARGRDRRTSIFTLILAGVAVGALFSAVTSFLIFLSSGGDKLSDVLFWMMGGLGRGNWTAVAILAPIVCIGIGTIWAFSRDLNALSLGEEGAFHLGVNPDMLIRCLLAVTTVLTAAAVSMAGTIGFVGLVIPHVVRLLVGPDHRRLIPTAALAGGSFLVWADTAARTVFSPTELPVGVITAFLGAPFFLFLLKRKGAQL